MEKREEEKRQKELRQRIVAEYSVCSGYDDHHRKEIAELIGEYNAYQIIEKTRETRKKMGN